MQQGSVTQQSVPQQSVQATTPAIAKPTDPTPLLVGLLIAFPIAIALGVIAFKYYRANIRRKRVEKLERLWHLNLERK